MVTNRKQFLQAFIGITLGAALSCPALASNAGETRLDGVEHIIGFEGVPVNSKGSLEIGDRRVGFRLGEEWKSLSLDRVRSAEVGYERQETGGTAGKVTRVLVPYGGGALLGLATQRRIGLLTIRYDDVHAGFHEALLEMPEEEAIKAQQQITAEVHATGEARLENSRCALEAPSSGVRIAMENSAEVPPEYEAAIYEHLVADVHTLWPSAFIFRGNDEQRSCKAVTVTVKLIDSKKGNSVARASTGPLGLFIGVTRVNADVLIQEADGERLWQRTYKASRRGDRESLGVASSMALSITKDLAKADLSKESHPQAE